MVKTALLDRAPSVISDEDTLNKLELMSINALIAYTAYQYSLSQDIVREMIHTRFRIKEVTHLPSASYDNAVRFLVDTQVDLLVN